MGEWEDREGNIRLQLGAEVGDVDQGDDVDSELPEDRADNVEVENVGLRPRLGQALNGPRSRDGEEADAHKHATDCVLAVAEFDALEIQHAQTISRDQAVQRKDLVHLDRGDKSAPALADDVGDGDDISQLAREGRSYGGVAELKSRWLVVVELVLHHARSELVGETNNQKNNNNKQKILVDELLGARARD